jgi:hypothetical protein
MRAHTLLSKVVVSLCALAATLAVSCVPAGAEVTHKFLSSITEVPAQGPKGEAIAQPGLLNGVNSMTIDGGDLYVAEGLSYTNTTRTDLFDTTTHAFVKQFDLPAPPVEGADTGIAVGHANGSTQVYVGAGERTGGELYDVVVPFDAEGHQIGNPWRGEDTPNGNFRGKLGDTGGGQLEIEGNLADVAVDNDPTSLLGDWAAGDVFVATKSNFAGLFPAVDVIDVLKPEAGGTEKYQTQLTGTCESPGACPGKVMPFKSPRNVVVNPRNGDLLVVDGEESVQEVVDMFRPGPGIDEYEFVGSVTGSPQGAFSHIRSIAVDGGEGSFAEGEFYVVEAGDVYQFDSAGQYVGRFSAQPGSAAIDPSTHDVYLGAPDAEEGQVEIFGPSLLLPDVTTGPVSNLAPEGATLNGTVNPDKAEAGKTTCRFVWGTSESFGHVLPCVAPVAEGESPVPVSADLGGLEPGTTYYYRLQASNDNGTNEGEASQTQHFTTPGPGLLEESAFGISSTSATVAALIDPHGASTTYYFQYGTTTAYGSDTPAAPGDPIGAGESNVEVTRHLQGLSPSTVYHYRVVAVSELEVEPGVTGTSSFDGHDETFTTQASGGSLVLPDGRAWEQVSPVDKHGADIFPLEPKGDVIQSSDAGDSMTYVAFGPTEAAAPGYDAGVQVLSRRGSHDWSSQDLALSHSTATGGTLGGGDFRFFSGDLSLGLAEPAGLAEFSSLAPEVSPPDTEPTLYVRHNTTCGVQPSTCYLPLVTGAPGYADVPSGTVFGYHLVDGTPAVNLNLVGATNDLSHVVFSSTVALTAEPIEEAGLYEWSAGKPPAEELRLITGQAPGRDDSAFPINGRDAVSGDGSRVIFETRAAGSTDPFGHLYQRDLTRGQTVQLDEVQPGASGAGTPGAIFQAASSDGSIVYFTDRQRLTGDSGASGSGNEPDLYECKMHEAAGEEKCDLADVTPETAGQRANVQGAVLGTSEDGAYVYFVATGVLSDQPNSTGQRAVADAPNVYEDHNGAIKLIAVLSSKDKNDWAQEPNLRFVHELERQTTRVSPDGRYLAFMSDQSLTGYDNVDVSSDKPDEEVFLLDAGTDRLTCASCNPSGARPEGVELAGSVNEAASIPGWTPYRNELSLYQSRYLSNSGRLFFNSSDALVPQDINKQQDVYEYEPVSIGDCTASSPNYVASADGCAGLISSGTSKAGSIFMDASDSGDDVFFLTTEKLVGSDVDSAGDVYDAHVCSTEAPCPNALSSPPPCTTADSCRSAPLPQPGIFGSPASATFVGAGNATLRQGPTTTPKSLTRAQKLARALKICHRKTKRKRTACERKARKRYPGKQARKARVTKGGRG